MYVLMNKQGWYWDGLGWDTDLAEAERYATEELADQEAYDILEDYGVAAHAEEIDEENEPEQQP